jgi:hypothetical protein
VILAQESQERSESALLKNVISALRTVAGDVPKGPDSLLTDVQYGRRQKFDEFRNCLCVDDDLSVFSSPRRDVGERPGSFKLIEHGGLAIGERSVLAINGSWTHLEHGVAVLQELDETGNNTAVNNAFNWRISLL